MSSSSSPILQGNCSDQRLIDAGGDPKGTLDYYNVHYYEWAGTNLSPFHRDRSRWALNKPVVVGEFYTGTSERNDDGSRHTRDWPRMLDSLKDIYSEHPSAVEVSL